ncbi:MAG: DNA polymerase III subunit delta [Alphaproteobacteria bacterium]|nr:DNA polymerase III subunit delta [Alphaproteobacteria bacterium]
MKISGRGVDPFLANPPHDLTAVLIYGHDLGLIKERAATIARHFVPDLNDPFSVTSLSADAIVKDIALLVDSAAAMPAMGGHRLVRVDQAGGTCLNAMKALLASKPRESLTVVTGADDLNTKSALVKLFEQTDHAAAIGCYADTNQSLGQLAQDIFRAHQIKADATVMNHIIEHLGADRMASRSEIDKLVLLAGPEGTLTLEQTRHALGDGAGVTVNDTIYAAASGDMKALSTALNRVQHDAIPGERLLRSGQMYFQRLFRLAAVIESGTSRDQAISASRPPIFFSEKRMVEAHLRIWSSAKCRRAMDRLVDAEKQSRRGISSDTAAAQALMALALAVRR